MQRAHPGDEFAKVERLHEVVIGAGIQALDSVGRRIAGRQHQDGGRPVVAPGPGRHLHARYARHPPVEDGHIVFIELQLLDRIIAAVDRVHQVAGILESLDEDLA